MSALRFTEAAWKAEGLSGAAKLTLLALARYAGEAGVCWPPAHVLATDTGLSRATVRRAADALVAAGLVTCERTSHRGHHTCRYTLKLGAGE